jgi:hypothetical protein
VFGAPLIAGVTGLYLISRIGGDPNGWNVNYPTVWGRLDYVSLCLFWLLEFGIFAFVCLKSTSVRDRDARVWLWLACAVLTLLPLYRFGVLNDLVMRASIPALFVLWVFVGGGVADLVDGIRRRHMERRLVVLAILVRREFLHRV